MLFGRRRSVSRGQASGWRRRASRGVFEVDCLFEPCAEDLVYPRSRRSLDRIRTPVWKLPGYGIMPARVDQFAGKAIHNGLKLANMNTCREPNRMPDQRLTNSSRTTFSSHWPLSGRDVPAEVFEPAAGVSQGCS